MLLSQLSVIDSYQCIVIIKECERLACPIASPTQLCHVLTVNNAGLELPSGKWKWYWILCLAVACWLTAALIIYSLHQCWRSRQISREAAAMQNTKLGGVPTSSAGQGTTGRGPVMLTASAGAGMQPVSNPYYSSSYAPAPGLQQPPRASYVYPGSRHQ